MSEQVHGCIKGGTTFTVNSQQNISARELAKAGEYVVRCGQSGLLLRTEATFMMPNGKDLSCLINTKQAGVRQACIAVSG